MTPKERRALGLCWDCDSPPMKDRTRCEFHLVMGRKTTYFKKYRRSTFLKRTTDMR